MNAGFCSICYYIEVLIVAKGTCGTHRLVVCDHCWKNTEACPICTSPLEEHAFTEKPLESQSHEELFVNYTEE